MIRERERSWAKWLHNVLAVFAVTFMFCLGLTVAIVGFWGFVTWRSPLPEIIAVGWMPWRAGVSICFFMGLMMGTILYFEERR